MLSNITNVATIVNLLQIYSIPVDSYLCNFTPCLFRKASPSTNIYNGVLVGTPTRRGYPFGVAAILSTTTR